MRIVVITAGAAGMYCGSCMHDNTLAAALNRLGHDALLMPTYTPIRTDEVNVSQSRVFFGGINVFLQQKSWLFRHTPWLLDRLLDYPRLLRWVSRFAVNTKYEDLGDLTISMLQGKHGHQAKEVDKLVTWLQDEHKPDVILLTNVLLSGIIPELKRRLGIPIFPTLQGDDIFLAGLPERDRRESIRLIGQNCALADGFLVTSGFYADAMAEYLQLPRTKMHIIYPGLNLRGHGGPREHRSEPPYTIGYFARICPEKGFHHLVDAFLLLKQNPDAPACKLRVSGWLGENNRPYFDANIQKLTDAGYAADVEYIESPNHASKVRFLQSLDLLSVPTTYHEPKGLYILEALANGTPVVQPRHGSFPELIEATGGGYLVAPDDPVALAEGILTALRDSAARIELGRKGQAVVLERFTDQGMAMATLELLQRFVTAPATDPISVG